MWTTPYQSPHKPPRPTNRPYGNFLTCIRVSTSGTRWLPYIIYAPVYHQHVRLVNRPPGSERVVHDHRSVARRLYAYICSRAWKNHIRAKAHALSIQTPMSRPIHNIPLCVITQVSKGWSGFKGLANRVLSIEGAIAFTSYCYCLKCKISSYGLAIRTTVSMTEPTICNGRGTSPSKRIRTSQSLLDA